MGRARAGVLSTFLRKIPLHFLAGEMLFPQAIHRALPRLFHHDHTRSRLAGPATSRGKKDRFAVSVLHQAHPQVDLPGKLATHFCDLDKVGGADASDKKVDVAYLSSLPAAVVEELSRRVIEKAKLQHLRRKSRGVPGGSVPPGVLVLAVGEA